MWNNFNRRSMRLSRPLLNHDGVETGDAPLSTLNTKDLLLLSLLDYLCRLFAEDEQHGREVWKVLCGSLERLNITAPFISGDELSSLRMHYMQNVGTLLSNAFNAVSHQKPGSLSVVRSRARSLFSRSPQPNIFGQSYSIASHTSRYRDEFKQLSKLGAGAYGAVYKVRNNLDGCYYAIKKIAFKDATEEIWKKALREVQFLARIVHINVVRYNSAWLEYSSPLQQTNPGDDQHQPNIVELDEDESSPSLKENSRSLNTLATHAPEGDSSDDSIVVFAEKSDHNLALAPYQTPKPRILDEQQLIQNCFTVLHIQMQLCDMTLTDWLRDRNSCRQGINYVTAVDVLRQVLTGLKCLHDNHLLHRDIKPKNIFLCCNDGKNIWKLGDLGLTRAMNLDPMTPNPGGSVVPHSPDDAHHMTSGVGTTCYASPEQLRRRDYDTKSDMYSIGLLFLELLVPFSTEMERFATLSAARKGEYPAKLTAEFPNEAKILAKLLHEDPKKRPSAQELLQGPIFCSTEQQLSHMTTTVETQAREIVTLRDQLRERDAEIARMRAFIAQLQSAQEPVCENGR